MEIISDMFYSASATKTITLKSNRSEIASYNLLK